MKDRTFSGFQIKKLTFTCKCVNDHPTSKDEDDAQKGEEPKDETQTSESKEETAVSKETALFPY